MFSSNGKDNQSKSSKNGNGTSALVNLIGVGTQIEGEIISEGDIRIDGKVKGTIKSHAKIVVGATGVIDGDMICQNADISGTITGTIGVTDLLYLKSTANIEGDISTAKIVVEAGAKFNGSCNMGGGVKKMPAAKQNGQAAPKEAYQEATV